MSPDDTLRRRFMQLDFDALQIGNAAVVEIMPMFRDAWPNGQQSWYGRVERIEDGVVSIRTPVGLWFFRRDGLSATGQAHLLIPARATGTYLSVYFG